jgi:hypothetical protein
MTLPNHFEIPLAKAEYLFYRANSQGEAYLVELFGDWVSTYLMVSLQSEQLNQSKKESLEREKREKEEIKKHPF